MWGAWWLSGKRICLQYKRLVFDPWVGKIPLEEEGRKRVKYNLATK